MLRQGVRREHVGPVVAVCSLSDAVLIVAGVHGAATVLARLPWMAPVLRLAGAAFLVAYGLMAVRRALRPLATGPDLAGVTGTLPATVATCLALTWLNPHVYLDTMVMLGSIANTYATGRWWFAAGAVTGSLAWFTALGYGARLLRPLLRRPGSWRILDAGIAVVMVSLAAVLVAGL